MLLRLYLQLFDCPRAGSAGLKRTDLVPRQPSSTLHGLFSQVSYFQTLSTSFNKLPKKRLNWSLIPVGSVPHLSHSSLFSWEPLAHNGPACLCVHHKTLLLWCGWEMPGTVSLNSWPTSHWPSRAKSLIFISFSSYTSSVMKLQPWQWMWITSEFSEPGELSEITRFHQQREPTLQLFFLKPTRSHVPQMTTFMMFLR